MALALVLVVGASSASADTTYAVNAITESAALTIDAAAGSALTLGDVATTGNIIIGGSQTTGATSIYAGTGGLNLGTLAVAKTINLGTGAAVQTINIGTGAAANVITVGTTNTTSSLALKAGSGGVVVTGVLTATSPVFTTPSLGVATATSINGNIFTAGSSTYTGTAGQTYTFPTTSATIAGTDAANTFTGVQTMTSPVLITPALGVATGTSLVVTGALRSITATVLASTGTVSVDPTLGQVFTVAVGTSTAVTYNAASAAIRSVIYFVITNTSTADTITLGTGFRVQEL